jgi:hypothetical protein
MEASNTGKVCRTKTLSLWRNSTPAICDGLSVPDQNGLVEAPRGALGNAGD